MRHERHAGPGGPYRAAIEDHLDSSADYLGRLRRSLAGGIAPDRHYFADKAHQLHNAARRMLRIVQDIDHWLGECGTTLEHDEADGTRLIGECTLPAGHDGPHDDNGAGGSSLAASPASCATWPTRSNGSANTSAGARRRSTATSPTRQPRSPTVVTRWPTWRSASTPSGAEPPGSPRGSAPSTSSPTPHSRAGPHLDVCHHPQTRTRRLVCDAPDGTAPRTRDGANRGPSGRASW
jgi:hypothetical protein